jgi:hypothetical protein
MEHWLGTLASSHPMIDDSSGSYEGFVGRNRRYCAVYFDARDCCMGTDRHYSGY